ncbi:MAG: hypothetical protein ACREA0_13885 [bacterium]
MTGPVVRGEDFFDREREQARFWRDLETDNLLLLAPRRVGKTSLMRRLGETAPDKGYTAVFVDVSDAGGEAVFVGRLYQAVLETEASNPLWGQMEKSWLGKLVRRVKKLSGPGFSVEFDPGQAGDWSTLGRDLAEALSGLERRWLLQIDELPVFILKLLNDGDAARERVREFLYWMRRLRLEFPAVRWMLAGSIGLDTVTARLNVADAINGSTHRIPGGIRAGYGSRPAVGAIRDLRDRSPGIVTGAHHPTGGLARALLPAARISWFAGSNREW